jgi:hypothetical protein
MSRSISRVGEIQADPAGKRISAVEETGFGKTGG